MCHVMWAGQAVDICPWWALGLVKAHVRNSGCISVMLELFVHVVYTVESYSGCDCVQRCSAIPQTLGFRVIPSKYWLLKVCVRGV